MKTALEQLVEAIETLAHDGETVKGSKVIIYRDDLVRVEKLAIQVAEAEGLNYLPVYARGGKP